MNYCADMVVPTPNTTHSMRSGSPELQTIAIFLFTRP
jgi:hypothetical protein